MGALWALKYVLGQIDIPNKSEMRANLTGWAERLKTLKGCHDEIKFQTDFVLELAKDSDVLTYRDKSFTSIFTGTKSPIHHSTFMTALDDSKECFMATK